MLYVLYYICYLVNIITRESRNILSCEWCNTLSCELGNILSCELLIFNKLQYEYQVIYYKIFI